MGGLKIKGTTFDVRRYSIHDGPGIRTTVFFKGCPLQCAWCHNPESQSPGLERMFLANRCVRCGSCLEACEQGALSEGDDLLVADGEKCTLCGACAEVCYAEAQQIVGREVEVSDLVAEIERDLVFYDESGGGLTISGGEPLMQPDFLLALLQACRSREIHTALDTCGYAPWETLDRIRGYVNLFLYDLKLMDDTRHRQFTGVSNEPILANLQALSERGHRIQVRLPIIPGINDDRENVELVGAFVASLPRLECVDLLPYHAIAGDKYQRLQREYDLGELQPPSTHTMDRAARILRSLDLRVSIGG
jgi:pyruvate formate lyase activating enzyme